MRFFESVADLVGRTPLVRLNRVVDPGMATVYAKLEYLNPTGSVKDRIAVNIVRRAEEAGLLRPGATLVESTSGNTGLGLAMMAGVRGYRCICTMPDKMSKEKIDMLKAFGAEVVVTRTDLPHDHPESYVEVAKRIARETPGGFYTDQYANPTNPEAHYLTTGPEIWEDTGGAIDCLVGGIGTGGTISGVGKYLKERNPAIRIVGADPDGSVLSGGTPKPWKVEGIGEDYVPKTFNSQVVDEWVRVTDKESFLAARKVARMEGLLIGGSCGTCVAAALRFAERLTPSDLVVVMMPDTGRNYLSKVYNDDWMRENGYLAEDRRAASARDVLTLLGARELLHLSPDQTMQDAIEMCRTQGISQLPILDGDQVVGAIQEVTLARLLHDGLDPRNVPLRDIMARPLPTVQENVSVDEVYRMLMSGNTGVIVRANGKIAGIITRIDLVNFWDAQRT